MNGNRRRDDEDGEDLAGRPFEGLTRSLPLRPESVARARAIVEEALGGRGCDESQIATVELLTSELVTNAVVHARGPICLRLGQRRRGTIWVGVEDGTTSLPARRSGGSDGDGGRGLGIVSALARRWGVDVETPRKMVWAELDLDEAR